MGSIATTNTSERAVADIFNSTVAGWAIGAAWELGVLDEVREKGRLNAQTFSELHSLETKSIMGLVSSLVVASVLYQDGEDVVPGKLFAEVYRTKSLSHWLALGCGSLFSRMQYMLRNENRKDDFYTRDSAAIAYACRDINRQYFDPAF